MLDKLYSIKNIYSIIVIAISLFLCFDGCAPSKSLFDKIEEKKEVTKPTQKEMKLPLSAFEATLNPADYDDEVEIVQKIHAEDKKKQRTIEIPQDSITVVEEIIQGFRIQIYSSLNVDEAVRAKSIAVDNFATDSVYMVYDAPVYKIRVGDFINRYEANQRLPEIVEKGYRDAWVVPDRVVQRKLVRISNPK